MYMEINKKDIDSYKGTLLTLSVLSLFVIGFFATPSWLERYSEYEETPTPYWSGVIWGFIGVHLYHFQSYSKKNYHITLFLIISSALLIVGHHFGLKYLHIFPNNRS